MATASADKKGMKRICPSCSTRYYDFNKRPVNCPNCKVEFTGEIKTRARRARVASNDVIEDGQVSEATAVGKGAVDADDEEVLLEGEEGVVSLEDLDEDEDDEIDEEEADIDTDADLELDEEDDLDEEDLDDEEEDDEDDDEKPSRKKK